MHGPTWSATPAPPRTPPTLLWAGTLCCQHGLSVIYQPRRKTLPKRTYTHKAVMAAGTYSMFFTWLVCHLETSELNADANKNIPLRSHAHTHTRVHMFSDTSTTARPANPSLSGVPLLLTRAQCDKPAQAENIGQANIHTKARGGCGHVPHVCYLAGVPVGNVGIEHRRVTKHAPAVACTHTHGYTCSATPAPPPAPPTLF